MGTGERRLNSSRSRGGDEEEIFTASVCWERRWWGGARSWFQGLEKMHLELLRAQKEDDEQRSLKA